MEFLLKGLILGFSIAAPVGPIGLLCIRRTLVEGKTSGFVSGLGAATADGFYGFVAAFGLTAISSLLLNYQLSIRVIGALFLFYVALRIFVSKPDHKEVQAKTNVSLLKSYTSTVALTLTNPSTFVVIGVFCGSALWWLLLSTTVGLLHHRISDKSMILINRIAGILMVGLGIFSLFK